MAQSITFSYHQRVYEIITPVQVSLPLSEKEIHSQDQRLYATTALWDTGATNSVITEKTALQLGLKPIDSATVYHAGGVSQQPVYLVNIYLPNGAIIPDAMVTGCPDTTGKFGVIIGMNVISYGDFAFTNVGSQSVFSFRMPSTETVDYMKTS
ncbi:hypothetical protein FACS189456_7550 [Bacteroidia bacterium]|nr:hypothetical protein FACS189456_7550 [Bacteroidia bacterium]